MKSRIVFLNSVISYIRGIIRLINNDKVTVYAAQASFFVITSAVPFISLLFALFSFILPNHTNGNMIGDVVLSEGLSHLVESVSAELEEAPAVSLLSISALTTLWSASRGISSVRRGIETVYTADRPAGYFRHRLYSIFTTLVFIALICGTAALLLFDDIIKKWFGGPISSTLLKLRAPLFILLMSVFFTLIYRSVSKRSSKVSHSFIYHVPGALFSSVGWVVFSYFYSLYIEHFPGATRVYGSLAAVCLIMLWIYFCMMILLLGAEINKLYFAGEQIFRKAINK
ncbi:MAG: YihY/virulence factor BrkB family protein [Clostridia bacterium]|nr:YihY/virulence factor BrkB family protein [Clostridia bacterium]